MVISHELWIQWSSLSRHDFDQLLDVLLYGESSSDTSSSSEDDDMDALLMEMAFASKVILGKRINLEDISERDCEQLFR